MLIPLTDPTNPYSAQMRRLIEDHQAQAREAIAASASSRRPEARAREIVSRAFARRHSSNPSPAF